MQEDDIDNVKESLDAPFEKKTKKEQSASKKIKTKKSEKDGSGEQDKLADLEFINGAIKATKSAKKSKKEQKKKKQK